MSVANPINSPAGTLEQSCWKRKGSEGEDENVESKVKKARYSWYVTLKSESPQPTSTDEDDESIYSVQEQETEFVQDTSDTSTHTWVSTSDSADVSVHVEYEVASRSESENPFIDSLSSSDPEDIIRMGMIAAICDSDLGLADDSDDSRSSRDSEISRADYWTCFQCNTKNNNPVFRYCEKCYQIRKNFFPPRPKWKRRRSRKKSKKNKAIEVQDLEGHELIAIDSGFGSSQGSQATLSFDTNSINKTSSSGLDGSRPAPVSLSQISTDAIDHGFSSSLSQLNSNILSQEENTSTVVQNNKNQMDTTSENYELEHGSQESICSTGSTISVDSKDFNQSDSSVGDDLIKKINALPKKAQLQNDPENKFCLICTVGPKNGGFLHGKIIHICCCYPCANKVWRTTKHCPICNRKVSNVYKAFYI